MGIDCNTITSNDTNERNISISRCYITNQIYIRGTNWLIENNIINTINFDYTDYCSGNNSYPITAIIANNIVWSNIELNYPYCGYLNGANILINHNIIEGEIQEFDYTNITNNIFYYGDESAGYNDNYNSYNNNVTVYSSKDSLQQGTNSGSNDIYNPSTLFVSGGPSSRQTGGNILSYNWGVSSSSPAHSAATDGSDIGIYGGSSPMPNLTGASTLPQMTFLNINNSVTPVGGKLNINFKARTQN